MKDLIAHTVTGQAHGPNWAKWLGHLQDRPEIIGMELGTWIGESAEWMLDNICTHPTARYFCVDTFAGSAEHHAIKADCSTLYDQAKARLDRFGNRVQLIRGESHRALRAWTFLLDFIYIDAAHDSMNVLRDAVLAFEVLKPGGIVIFDDYEWVVFPDPVDCPKLAIDSFLACYSKQLEVIQRYGWQVCVKKK